MALRDSTIGALGIVAGLLSACASAPAPVREPAAAPDFPWDAEGQEMLAFVRTLDLSDESIVLEPSSGGTSAYFKILVDGRAVGAVIPENSATKIFGELAAYNLGRAVGRPALEGAGTLHELKGKGLERFRARMEALDFSRVSKQREANRRGVLAAIRKSPGSLLTVYKHWGPKPYSYDQAVVGNSLNENDVIARFLKATAPQPTDRLVSLKGVPKGQGCESDLARQLSTIFLIDALVGQWDRFSGGNLQVIVVDGRVQFVALDNGGAWGGEGWTRKFLRWVTRFDREVADTLVRMNSFLGGEITAFESFSSEAELRRAIGLELRPRYWEQFKRNLTLVASHIESVKGDKYFR